MRGRREDKVKEEKEEKLEVRSKGRQLGRNKQN
jgi:hypothetical protein